MCTVYLLHKNLTTVYIFTQDFNKLLTKKKKQHYCHGPIKYLQQH